jgi:hypothetical protein
MSIQAVSTESVPQAPRGQEFRYDSYRIDPATGELACHYSVDGRRFTERITLRPGDGWDRPAAVAAARLVFLLAGVSYYKTAAPPVIHTGDLALTRRERAFLREFYLEGLGEFAYRNGLDLSGLRIEGPEAPAPARQNSAVPQTSAAQPAPDTPHRALVPFGGGIDSIVTVELVRPSADIALFVVSRPGDRFEAIEQPAAVTGLPVVRAAREIDPQLLRSRESGFLNGHVPVTGIISAIAVLAAVLEDRDAVIMSNEWSASVPTVQAGDHAVNHQYSKSASFEAAFRGVLAQTPGLPEYFSALRARTELWIADQFAHLTQYHSTFRSCNRAFHIDPARRLDHWCGQCDKCCFIDLILAPFLPAADLAGIFDSHEPLTDPALAFRFRALLGDADLSKPFECVGEVNECRAAVLLAADRPDRAGQPSTGGLLGQLAAEVRSLPDQPSTDGLLHPAGEHFIPASYATKELLA